MIGSHDTFTYLKAERPLFNIAKCWWKTQCKTIDQQYAWGVRMFDIRVRRERNKWRVCHGIVDLKMKFKSLDDICQYVSRVCPEAIYRIVLERGNSDRFKKESKGICSRYPNLWRVDIKSSKNWMGSVDNNNQALYDKGYKFALVNTWEEPAHEIHGTLTAKRLFNTDLKKDAKRLNNQLPFFKIDGHHMEKMLKEIESKDELYLIDYCTNRY